MDEQVWVNGNGLEGQWPWASLLGLVSCLLALWLDCVEEIACMALTVCAHGVEKNDQRE